MVDSHQILVLGDVSVGIAYGVDLLQALLLSVYAPRMKLVGSGTTLDWLGMLDAGLTGASVHHHACVRSA